MNTIKSIAIFLRDFMLDKLMASFRPKPPEEPKEEPVVEEQQEATQPQVQPDVPDPVAVQEWETKLIGFVYDEELAKDLAPVFVKLSSAEGFDKVLELLATKEKQIEAIGSSHYKLQSEPENIVTQSEAKPVSATDILKARYSQNLK